MYLSFQSTSDSASSGRQQYTMGKELAEQKWLDQTLHEQTAG